MDLLQVEAGPGGQGLHRARFAQPEPLGDLGEDQRCLGTWLGVSGDLGEEASEGSTRPIQHGAVEARPRRLGHPGRIEDVAVRACRSGEEARLTAFDAIVKANRSAF